MQLSQLQESEIRQEDHLIFCYSQQNPNTLVMLYPPELVVQKMLKPVDQPYVVWIIEDLNQQLESKIGKIQKQSSAIFIILADVTKLKQFLLSNKQLKNCTIVCSPGILEQVKLLNRWKQIGAIIEYPAQSVDDNFYDHETGHETNSEFFVLRVQNQDQLFDCIEDCCLVKPHYKSLTNFVALKGDIEKSNVMIRAMMAIINQPIDQNTRYQIVSWFQKLVYKIQKYQKIQQFIQELRQGPLPFNRAIYWYTHQVGIYKIVNNLLRSNSHPCEIFYLQPFFKDLFLAVQTLQKEIKTESFVCYRGGFIQKNQIEELSRNVGQVVKNLSFLSTSLSQSTAMSFKNNVLFEILVPSSEVILEQFKFSYGYAKIKQVSQFAAEEEILFNPLCSFKVIEIKEIQDKNSYEIKLRYQKLEKNTKQTKNTSLKQLIQRQNILNYLGKQWKKIQKQITGQGYALTYHKQSEKNDLYYWQKYNQISINFQNKINGLIQLGTSLRNKGISSQKMFQKAMLIFKQKYGNFDIQEMFSEFGKEIPANQNFLYLQILFQLVQAQIKAGHHLEAQQMCSRVVGLIENGSSHYAGFLVLWANSLTPLGQYQKAAELYKNALKASEQEGNYTPRNFDILNNLALTYRDMGKTQQAYKLCQKSLQLILATTGQRHQRYRKCLQIMAGIFFDMRQYKRYVQIYKKCCKMTEEAVGVNNIKYVLVLNRLAFAQKIVRNYEQAQKNCEISLKICQKIQDQSLQFTRFYIQSLSNYSNILTTQAKHQQALQNSTKTWKLSQQKFGQHNPISYKSLTVLAGCLFYLNRLKQAEQSLKKCCQISLHIFGIKNINYFISLRNLASIYLKNGKNQSCLQLLRQCLVLTSVCYGEKNKYYLSILQSYASALEHTKQYQQSVIQLQKYYSTSIEIFGYSDQQRKYPSKLSSLITMQLSLGRNEEALSTAKQLVRLTNYQYKDKMMFNWLRHVFGYIHQQLGAYRKSTKIMRTPLTRKTNPHKKNKQKSKQKSKQQLRVEQKGIKEKSKLNYRRTYIDFHSLEVSNY